MFNVALITPEIPHNTGAIGRLCLSTGSKLHLVRPLGFDLDEKAVKRAGLDYWKNVDLVIWETFAEFWEHLLESEAGYHLLTTKTEKTYWDAKLQKGDYLLFGAETKGLPKELIESHADHTLTIPMDREHVRSLNLATAAGIVLFEGMRQVEASTS